MVKKFKYHLKLKYIMVRKKTPYEKFKKQVKTTYKSTRRVASDVAEGAKTVGEDLGEGFQALKTDLQPVKKGSDKMVSNLEQAFGRPHSRAKLVRYVERGGVVYAELSDGRLVKSKRFN